MKKKLFALMLAALLLLSATAFAASRASTVFSSATVSLSSGKTATFNATASSYSSSISVTSVRLYVKTGDTWTYARSLPVPATTSSGLTFRASKDYSAYISSGTYRINATFSADAGTVTRVSNTVTY